MPKQTFSSPLHRVKQLPPPPATPSSSQNKAQGHCTPARAHSPKPAHPSSSTSAPHGLILSGFTKKGHTSPWVVSVDCLSFAPVIQHYPEELFLDCMTSRCEAAPRFSQARAVCEFKESALVRCSAPTVSADLNRTESPHLKRVSPTETCTEHATAFDFHRARHKDRFPLLLSNLESLSKSLKSTFQQ